MYIGIDLGGTNIKAGVVDEKGNILHKDSIPTHAERPAEEIVKDMAMLAIKVVKDAGFEMKDMKSVGIASPGTPDSENGVLVYANNLPFLNMPMRAVMQQYIDLPIYLDNDANCAGLAEAKVGAGKGKNDVVTITLGTGVGGGVVIDGKIYNGFNNAASEIGHMVIVVDGEQCTCGRKGCFECYASATGLVRQTKEAMDKAPDSIMHELAKEYGKVSAKTAFQAAKKGDKAGLEVVEQYIKYLGVGISNIINIFMPEMVCIGGGVCNEGDYLLNPLREFVKKNTYSRTKAQTEVTIAEMGNDAGIIGAAFLGM